MILLLKTIVSRIIMILSYQVEIKILHDWIDLPSLSELRIGYHSFEQVSNVTLHSLPLLIFHSHLYHFQLCFVFLSLCLYQYHTLLLSISHDKLSSRKTTKGNSLRLINSSERTQCINNNRKSKSHKKNLTLSYV